MTPGCNSIQLSKNLAKLLAHHSKETINIEEHPLFMAFDTTMNASHFTNYVKLSHTQAPFQ